MDNQQERLSFNKGWVVGLIDGEGCFLLTKKTKGFFPAMQLGNCRVEVVQKLKEVLKELDIPFYVCPNRVTKGNRVFERIDIGGLKRLEKFFQVFPLELFECKWDEAWIVKQYVDYRLSIPEQSPFSQKETTWYQMLRDMNR